MSIEAQNSEKRWKIPRINPILLGAITGVAISAVSLADMAISNLGYQNQASGEYSDPAEIATRVRVLRSNDRLQFVNSRKETRTDVDIAGMIIGLGIGLSSVLVATVDEAY